MRGQLLQHMHSRYGISAVATRHARCGYLVTLVALGLAGVTGAAGAQQASEAPVSQSVLTTNTTTGATTSATTGTTTGTTTTGLSQTVAAAEPAPETAGHTPAQTTAMQPGAGPRHLDAFIGIQSGTLGFGVQAAKLIISHVGVRAGFNFFNFGINNTESDIKYSARLRFQNLPVMVDIFPWARGTFHVTGGVIFDQNRITGTGQSDAEGNITINHNTYTQAQIGVLSGAVRYPATAGYAGIGFGTPARNSLLTFTTDIGVMISTPKVSLSATGAGSNPQLKSDLQAQQASTQADINKYAKIYPVISAGIAVRI